MATEVAADQSSVGLATSSPRRASRAADFVRRHLLETIFVAFTLTFFALLRFIDTGNLWAFFLSSAYLTVGRNSYSLYAIPAPPGLFLSVLPSFGVYVFSGYNSQLANLALKGINLAALFGLSVILGKIGSSLGLDRRLARGLRTVTLLSPVLFFLSFVWVEQDVIGLALTGAALLLVLRGSKRLHGPWEEVAGFGLLAFATFTYYFPAFLVPTLVVYSRTVKDAVRRLAYAAVAFGGFLLWFFLYPGWDFVSASVGTTSFPSISVYSPLALFSSVPFGPATALQLQLRSVFVIVLIVTELTLPVLFRRWNVSWTVSLAFAVVLPFLFLNIWNGDEFVWPLPFLLVALLVTRPSSVRGFRLWLVQLYCLPMVLLCNLFDAPGPGAGSGIFYFGYAQFHNAVSLSLLIPQPLTVARILQLSLWSALIALVGTCLAFDRLRDRTQGSLADGRFLAEGGPPGERGEPPAVGGIQRNRDATMARYRTIPRELRWVATFALAGALVTIVAAALPAPVLTATSSNEFPVGLFSEYPVANGSVTYTFSPGSNTVEIASNYGNWTTLGMPWQQPNFTRNIADEEFSMDLGVTVTAPSWFPYNTSILAYGSSALNAVVPFVPPSESALLSPVLSHNVSTAPTLTSPQLVGGLAGALEYNGSSFAQYNAVPLEQPGGQVSLLFRWSGVQLLQNVIVTLYRGDVSYQLFGVGGVYTAGMKPTLEGDWTFSYPRLVNRLSWHELTLTNASNGTQIALDGIPIPLPPVPLSSEKQGAELLVGSVDTSSEHFQRNDFWGIIAGPYNTTNSPVTLGNPLWCPVSWGAGTPPLQDCTPYSSSTLSVQSRGEGAVSATTPWTTYWLNSTPAILEFGRLSDVGPPVTIQIRSLSISTDRTLFPLVWLVDGAVGAPAALALLSRARRQPSGVSPPA